jgi:hypothetical protein
VDDLFKLYAQDSEVHFGGGKWSQHTDASKPVVGYGANNNIMVISSACYFNIALPQPNKIIFKDK